MRKLRVTKTLVTLASALILCGAMVISAQAFVVELDFSIPVSGPTVVDSISYAGGANPLVGTNIPVASVTGINTPLNSGATLTITGGALNFATGNFIGSNPEEWEFAGPPGTMSVTGGIPALSLASTTLASGPFVGTADVDQESNAQFYVSGASFDDTKNQALLAYFGLGGLAGVSLPGYFNIGFVDTNVPSPGDPFTSTQVNSGGGRGQLMVHPAFGAAAGQWPAGPGGLRLAEKESLTQPQKLHYPKPPAPPCRGFEAPAGSHPPCLSACQSRTPKAAGRKRGGLQFARFPFHRRPRFNGLGALGWPGRPSRPVPARQLAARPGAGSTPAQDLLS